MANQADLSRVAVRLSHSMHMVAQLPSFVDDQQLPVLPRLAYVEDWYLNYRLLIEFFLLKPSGNCASPEDFIPGWRSSSAASSQLKKDYGLASEDFAHIGNLKGREAPAEADSASMKSKAKSILEIAQESSDILVADAVAPDYLEFDEPASERYSLADRIRISVKSVRGILGAA